MDNFFWIKDSVYQVLIKIEKNKIYASIINLDLYEQEILYLQKDFFKIFKIFEKKYLYYSGLLMCITKNLHNIPIEKISKDIYKQKINFSYERYEPYKKSSKETEINWEIDLNHNSRNFDLGIEKLIFLLKWIDQNTIYDGKTMERRLKRKKVNYPIVDEETIYLNCGETADLLLDMARINGYSGRRVRISHEKCYEDAHFFIEIYIKGKWIAVDPSYRLLFMKDNNYLSLIELRHMLVNNENFELIAYGKEKISKTLWIESMKKKIYRITFTVFDCVNNERLIHLVPIIHDLDEVDNPDFFWY